MAQSNRFSQASKLVDAANLTRLLVMASVAGPAIIFGLIAWFTYQSAFADAQRELAWTSDVAREHASKVFDSYKLVAERVQDLIDHVPDTRIRMAEQSYYENSRKIIEGLPQIESLIVLDRDGHLLIATADFPVQHETDFSDRDYFIALKSGQTDSFVSTVQKSRITGATFFGWGRPRRDAAGAFDGVIDIALAPDFFMRFYETLVRDVGSSPEGRVVTMVRTDGQLLVRYPVLPGTMAPVPPTSPLFTAISHNPESGTYTNRSVVDRGAPERLFAYRNVPGHPIYVVSGRSTSAIVAGWRHNMIRYLAVGIPATIALFLLSFATFQGTRREQEALSELRDEMIKRELIEEQLRQAQKVEAIGQLAGGIAHDFNNLLMVITSSINLLRRPDLPDDRRHRYVDAISVSAERGAKLTAQLLAFARRQALRPEVFDVVGNLTSIMDMIRTLIGSAIKLETDWPEAGLHVDADPTQFDTSIINLATNARDAMKGSGRLTLSVREVTEVPADEGQPLRSGSYVAIAVADTGSGIAADQMKHIFEPFFTTKEVGQGTGLGLSQVFGFVKQSGGEVRVSSQVGSGTTISLYLPLVSASAQASKPPIDLLADCRGMSVLLVEDNGDVRQSTIDNLRELGCNTAAVASGTEALDLLAERAGHFDVVFSDIVMPGINGIELGEKIRELGDNLPVVLTSGYSDMLTHRGVEAFDVLQKPYSVEQLSHALRKASALRRRERAI